MDFRKIFRTAFRYPLDIKIYLIVFIISMIFSVATQAVVAPLTTMTNLQAIIGYLGIFAVFFVVYFLINLYLSALFINNASKFYKGKRENLSKSIGVANNRFLPLLATEVLLLVIIGIILIIFGGIGLFLYSTTQNLISFILIAIGFIGVIIAAFFLFMAPTIAVLDKKGPVNSIKESFRLIKSNKLNALGFILLAGVIAMIIAIASALITLAFGLLNSTQISQIIQNLLFSYLTLFLYSAFANFFYALKRKR